MPKPEQAFNAIPSFLDRLLDDRPNDTSEASAYSQNIRQLEKALARDIEALLNTRREALQDLPSDYVETANSIITYGLPDFTSLSLLNPNDRNRIRRAVEQAIARFEPRLKRIRVTLEPPREHDKSLRFRVDAMLQVDPAPEPVSFDAALRLNTQEYVVQGQV